jgi:hypothetical protein
MAMSERKWLIVKISHSLSILSLMILSSGVLGALLLRFELTPRYFAVLTSVAFASYVSCRGFYDSILSREEADCQGKVE